MNVADEQTLTFYWNRETSHLNGRIDDTFREAQNHAYELGLKRGVEQFRWIPVSEKMPPADVPVMAYFVNEHGKHRRIKAFFAPRFTVETSVDNDWFEYNEAGDDDNAYLPEGWYESNEFEDTHWHVTATVTHWMALPLPPVE